MLAHQRGWSLRACSQRADDGFGCGCITERHREIAQPTLIPDAADGAAAGVLHKLRFAPGKQRHECCMIEAVPHGETGLASRARKFVPGADQLTIIAAKDAIADG